MTTRAYAGRCPNRHRMSVDLDSDHPAEQTVCPTCGEPARLVELHPVASYRRPRRDWADMPPPEEP
jgi:hypothetical protein